MSEIYLDNAATTRPWPEVVNAVEQVMTKGYGNASSRHSRGLQAERQVVSAIDTIVEGVGSGPWKVVFTSGGTEADNLAVLGSVPKGKRRKIVISSVEHAAVVESCLHVATKGCELVTVSAGQRGVVDPVEIEQAVDSQTGLVSLVYVAGEMGTVQPVAEVARRVKAKEPKCRVHLDAVQALAQIHPLDLPPEVDMVTVSSHKIHGPQGMGALLIRPHAQPRPLVFGGDQQERIRPGTLNMPGIVGFSEAVRLYSERRQKGIAQMRRLGDRLIKGVVASVDGVSCLGDQTARAPGIVLLAFNGVESEVLLHALEMRGVLASSSSACHATRKDPPRSLVDAGLKKNQGAVRFSLSLDTIVDDIDKAIEIITEAVPAVRSGRVSQ